MLENVNGVNGSIKMNNEVIYFIVDDGELCYTDKNIENCNIGDVIEYRCINDIHKNFRLYKNYNIIKYIKKTDGEFEKDFINSLKRNLNKKHIDMMKYGLYNLEYELEDKNFEKYLV